MSGQRNQGGSDTGGGINGAELADRDDEGLGTAGGGTGGMPGGESPYGASAGSVTGVGGAFAAEAAALGVDSGPLRDPTGGEAIGQGAGRGEAGSGTPGDKGDLGGGEAGTGPEGTAGPGGTGHA